MGHPAQPLAAWLFATLALAGPAPAQSSARVADIPFRLERNKILIPVTVAGLGTREFALDTGAPVTVIVAGEDDAPPDWQRVGQARIGGAGTGSSQMGWIVQSPAISVGEVPLDVGRVVVLPPQEALSASAGRPFLGIVGRALFERYVVRLDFESRRLRLLEPDGWRPSPRATVLPIRLEGGHPHIDVRVVTLKGDTIAIDLVVDTGSSLPLALDPDSVRAVHVPDGAITMVLGHGLAGPVRGPLGRIEALALGDRALPNVVTAFPDPRLGVTPNADGNLGVGILRRFTVTFDYPRARMILEPTAAIDAPYVVDASGLTLTAPGPDHHRIFVSEVRPGSPAADAGLHAGDEILCVDGVDAAGWSLAAVEARLASDADRRVSVTYQRDARRDEVTLRLRPPL